MKRRKVERFIIDETTSWTGCLGLNEWEVYVAFESCTKKLGKYAIASCTAVWEQKQARLTFDSKAMEKKRLNKDEIRATVLHEMLHCVCNGYERCHEDFLLEEMVSTLTCITLRCFAAGRDHHAKMNG